MNLDARVPMELDTRAPLELVARGPRQNWMRMVGLSWECLWFQYSYEQK